MDEMQAQDELNAGYDDQVPVKTETPTPEPEVHNQDNQQVAPKYAQITEEQLNDLLATKARLEHFEQSSKQTLDKISGHTGSMKQAIEKLQSQTKNGKPVEITEEDVADIAAEFPELGKLQLKMLQKVVGKLHGTAGNNAEPEAKADMQQQPAFTQEQLDQMVNDRLAASLPGVQERIERQFEAKTLARSHPDWKEVVGHPDISPDANESNNDFRKWLATQPELKAKLNDSWDADEIGKAITAFKASANKENTRKKRLEAAVVPRGTGDHGQASQAIDEMEAGYSS